MIFPFANFGNLYYIFVTKPPESLVTVANFLHKGRQTALGLRPDKTFFRADIKFETLGRIL